MLSYKEWERIKHLKYTGECTKEDGNMSKMSTETYELTGANIGRLVNQKNIEYGDSFNRSGEILKILYLNGIKPEDYKTVLAIVRILDKLFRIATNPEAFGENPWIDIAGYAILMVKQNAD